MSSHSPPNFQPFPNYQKDYLSFSPFMDLRAREQLFAEVEEASNASTAKSETDHFVPLDLTVKSPRNSPSEKEYFAENNKRKFDNSDDEEIDNKKQKNNQPAFLSPNLFPPLSINPPTPNPYLNLDLLSPLSLAPVPTPYMSLYNIGSPAPPTSSAEAPGSSSMNLTPPQTPPFPTFLPFQMPSKSQMTEVPYSLDPSSFYMNPMTTYNPYNAQMRHSPNSSDIAAKTPSPPPNEGTKFKKILPKPLSLSTPKMQQNNRSPPLNVSSEETSVIGNNPHTPRNTTPTSGNPHFTPSLSLPSQTMNINNQTIVITPISSSEPVSSSPISSLSSTSQLHMTPPLSSIPSMPPLMSLYPQYPYPGYLPYPYHQQFLPSPVTEPKPMSQALSFLFEKSLGSVRRWRENGITIQVFYCAVCNMPTDSEDRMRTHIETFHRDLASPPSKDGVFQCEVCNQVCIDEASLARHKLLHVSSNSHAEKCKGCNRKFNSQESLGNHEKDCTLYRPYRCEYCGRGYVVAARLKHHRQDCPSGPKAPVFSCKVCSKKFDDFVAYCHHVPVHAFM